MTDYTMFPEEEESVSAAPEETEDSAPSDGAENKPKKNKESKLKKENKALADEVERLKTELEEQSDKFIRLAAEYDNFRKRTQREKDGIYADAYGDCINAILPVVDNLERALMYTEGDKVVEGVRMTMNQFSEVLKKLGVEVIPTEVFDPMVHNAVMHEENEELGEGVITEVYQKGYKKGDRVIRYAMVKVAN